MPKRKNPAAVALGRKGGKKRMAGLTKQERAALASLGGKAKAENARRKQA